MGSNLEMAQTSRHCYTENKFYCDECSSELSTKKSLNAHKKKGHEQSKCEKFELIFNQKNKLKHHMKGHHLTAKETNDDACKCTSESVCDPCIH